MKPHTLIRVLFISFVILGVLFCSPQPSAAGSSGQQLEINYNTGMLRLEVWGRNQYGNYVKVDKPFANKPIVGKLVNWWCQGNIIVRITSPDGIVRCTAGPIPSFQFMNDWVKLKINGDTLEATCGASNCKIQCFHT